MPKLHIYKAFLYGEHKSYCGKSSDDYGEFLHRAIKGDICKSCITNRIAHKKIVRA